MPHCRPLCLIESPPCRDVIIPMGLVIDKRFRMTRGGKAVYVG